MSTDRTRRCNLRVATIRMTEQECDLWMRAPWDDTHLGQEGEMTLLLNYASDSGCLTCNVGRSS